MIGDISTARHVSSWSTRMTVMSNFFDNLHCGGVSWANRYPWPLRYGYLTLRGNALRAFTRPTWRRERGQDRLWPEGFPSLSRLQQRAPQPRRVCFVTALPRPLITIEGIAEKVWVRPARRGPEVRPERQRPHARIDGGSTVTFRLPWGPRAHLARPMLADAKIDGRWPAVPDTPADDSPRSSGGWPTATAISALSTAPYPDMTSDILWHPDCSNGYDLGVNHGASWYVGAETSTSIPSSASRRRPIGPSSARATAGW